MLSKSIERFLDEKHISYSTIPHTPAYTASQTAQAAHIPGKNIAKVVVIKLNGKLTLMAVPAHIRLDLSRLQKITESKDVELAHEYEFNDKFPGCEVGAMPPFGDLYGMEVYLADSLAHRDWIAFNCGSHSELLRMQIKDFLKLVHPKMLANC